MSTINWVWVAEEGSIPKNEGRRVFCANREIALFNLGQEYLAIDNRCPHKQGPLADGIVAGRAVFCPLHNLKINLADGCAMFSGAVRFTSLGFTRRRREWRQRIISGKSVVA